MNNVKDEYQRKVVKLLEHIIMERKTTNSRASQIVTSKVARLPSLGWLELHGKPSNIIVENFTTSSSWLGLMYAK